jgi:hypothetical protein
MRDLISRYFGLDAQRDTEGIVALFADDASATSPAAPPT